VDAATFPQRLGNELAGTIEAVGPGVGGVAVGDEVIGWAVLACYAEQVVTGADSVVPRPPGMPWPQAGALSASGQTASSVLASLDLPAGATLVVHGGAGGVGSMAVQLAIADGARVIATAHERSHDYLRSLGAEPVAYGAGVADRIRSLVDGPVSAVFDTSGSRAALEASLELDVPRDHVVSVSASPEVAALGVRRGGVERSTARLADLTARWSAGTLRVHVQHAYPLEHAAAAHEALERTPVQGKLVITP
jgi:enoyl reductase